MPDPITRLRAARFDGPQALYTEAVRLLSERPALPDDLAGLVDAGRRMSPRLDLLDCETALQMADAIEAMDRIKAEAKAEGMREAARIAADHTPEKHGGAPLAAHVTGKSIELAILAAIPEVRK